jgi:hypothetical protein
MEKPGPNCYRVTSYRIAGTQVLSSRVECEDVFAVAEAVANRLRTPPEGW